MLMDTMEGVSPGRRHQADWSSRLCMVVKGAYGRLARGTEGRVVVVREGTKTLGVESELEVNVLSDVTRPRAIDLLVRVESVEDLALRIVVSPLVPVDAGGDNACCFGEERAHIEVPSSGPDPTSSQLQTLKLRDIFSSMCFTSKSDAHLEYMLVEERLMTSSSVECWRILISRV
jgi:hypothetical protein